MADARQTSFEVPDQMREGAERSLEQARQALDTFIGAARRAVENMEQSADAARANTRDIAQRTFSSVEESIYAALDLAERLVRARDPQEATQIQADFLRSQSEALQAQMRELSASTQSALSQGGSGQTDPSQIGGVAGTRSRSTKK
jgi:phasin